MNAKICVHDQPILVDEFSSTSPKSSDQDEVRLVGVSRLSQQATVVVVGRDSIEEVGSVTHPGSGDELVTLAVRMTARQRAQLDIIAQLSGRSVTEEVRDALDRWITRAKDNPSLRDMADTARAEIDREAEMRRGAITALFGGTPGDDQANTEVPEPEPSPGPPETKSSRRRSGT